MMRKLAIMALAVIALASLSGTVTAETAKDKAANCCYEPAEEM